MDHRLKRLEHDARQPRLALVADGQANTKTHERAEGAATAVQVMHGDSCTAQKVKDVPKISTCFGVMAKPPSLRCRDDVVVENGAAAPRSCLNSWRFAHQQPLVAYFLLEKSVQQQRPPSTSQNYGSTRPRRRIQRKQFYGLQFHPPGTTAVAGN